MTRCCGLMKDKPDMQRRNANRETVRWKRYLPLKVTPDVYAISSTVEKNKPLAKVRIT